MTSQTRTAKPPTEEARAFVELRRNAQTEAGYLGIDGHTTDAELRSIARGLTVDAAEQGYTVTDAAAYVTGVRGRIWADNSLREAKHQRAYHSMRPTDAALAARISTERRFPGFGQDWR